MARRRKVMKAKTAKHVRMSVSVTPEFVQALTYVADRMQVSKSAALELFTGQALRDISTVLEATPDFSPEGLRVYRGASEQVIEERLREFQEVANAALRG